ncbi:MAG: radical SAM protein [Chloroflexi bacterium]|nr:radical SAM protein [Chloroflexota bacterium]
MQQVEQNTILYSPNIVQQERDGVYLLIDPSAPNWMSTNEIGSRVVRRCDGRHTLREIADSLHAETGLAPKDTEAFVRKAVEACFVATCPSMSPAYRGRAQAIAPGRLEELWVHTNNSCPLRCKHCLVDGGAETVSPLATGEIKGLVDEALSLGVGRVYFTGGDPFMRKDILELVEWVTPRAQLVVLTSGVLLTDEIVQRLSSANPGSLLVQVSLEGPDAQTNDAIRGKGNFDRAVAGIKRLVGSGLSPIVTTTVTALNQGRVVDTTRFLNSIGVRDHHILWLHARGRMRKNIDALLVNGSRVAEIMAELRTVARETGMVVDNEESLKARVRSKRGRKNDLCNCCFSELAVGPDGRVYPCASLVGAEAFDCGSIKERSLEDIWKSSSVTNWVREDSVQKRVGCSSCYLKFFCGGGCFAQSYFNYEITQGYGCIMAPDPYCEVYKSELQELMWGLAMPGPSERKRARPTLYRQMENILQSCAADGAKVIDAGFEVGTYHCSCVLAVDVEGH